MENKKAIYTLKKELEGYEAFAPYNYLEKQKEALKHAIEALQKLEDGIYQEMPKIGTTVYDRFADAWTIAQIDIYEDDKILVRCGHKGTDDYCALWLKGYTPQEVFFTEKEAAEAKRGNEG